MSRTRKGTRPPGYDYGSRRLNGWPSPGPATKKRTHRKERAEGKVLVITGVDYQKKIIHVRIEEDVRE